MPEHSHNHSSTRIGWAFFLNVIFTIIEFVGGWLTNSTAIMADAVHDLGDSLSIGMAWVMQKLSAKKADERFTYGYRRFSLLSSLINGSVLIAGSAWVMSEAIPRLSHPEMPEAEGMLGLAIFGIIVNGYAAYKLADGKTLNERILNWHLIEDVLGWVAVLIVSIVLLFIDLPILDPILSIAFTVFILFNAIKNMRSTIGLFLQAIPDSDTKNKIQQQLKKLPYVSDVHDLHFWSLDGEHHVLTVHLVLDKVLSLEESVEIKSLVKKQLSEYGLEHTTIEFELPNEVCRDYKV
jgi:cobalt-zinc-cadmium efflux system protein